MRLPFPERFPLRFVVLFAILLAAVQQLQGTDMLFTVCSFLFIVISALSFNIVGGFTFPSGGYIFFYALGVIVGITGKAIFGEPADSNLLVPTLTIEVFLGGAVAILIAAFVTRRLRPKRAVLQNTTKPEDMRNATLGCIITGIALAVLLYIPAEDASLLSALAQLNQFLPMAIILGTIYQIRKSGGASAFNLPVILAIVFSIVNFGFLHFSKQGMFLPVVCWLIAATSMRYRIRIYQLAAVGLVFFVMVYYLVPYSQVGRNNEGRTTFAGTVAVAAEMLQNLGQVRQEYVESSEKEREDRVLGYYDHPGGLLDRMQILRPDDDLLNLTEMHGPIGLWPIPLYFFNLVPHVFYPSKPSFLMGNTYAHEIGYIIAEDDDTTSISFSPSAEAYHIGGWFGVLVVMPVLLSMLFLLFDSLCGDVRKSPWGLLMIAVFSHAAPEGMLASVVYMMGYTTIGLLFAAIAASYVMPIIGTMLAGPDKTSPRLLARLRS